MSNKINRDFFQSEAVEIIAPKLLGKTLFTNVDSNICSGRIVEVEAYCGRRDKACHAFFGKTARNDIMFTQGGVVYVYLCYGIHKLLNIVTGPANDPSGILIRGVEPLFGVETMLERRRMSKLIPTISNGPGKVAQAFGIELDHYGEKINGKRLWLEQGDKVKAKDILVGKRIGIDYAGEDKNLPWRFALDSRFVGHKKLLTHG